MLSQDPVTPRRAQLTLRPRCRHRSSSGTWRVADGAECCAYGGGLLNDATTQGSEEPAPRDGAEGSSVRMDAVMRSTAAEILDNASRGRAVPEGLKRTAEEILGEDPPHDGAEGLSSTETEVVRLSAEAAIHNAPMVVERKRAAERAAERAAKNPPRRFGLLYGFIPHWRSDL